MDFEDIITKALLNKDSEKTFIDKLLAKDDITAVRELIKKDRLTRSELLEILYLLSSSESKLVNYSEWERYIILKYFVWIREFVKIAELLFDYEENLKVAESEGRVVITARTRRFLDNNQRLIEHNAKFLIDLYFNISRTSLSLKSSGFMELLKNKFEMVYDNKQLQTTVTEKAR